MALQVRCGWTGWGGPVCCAKAARPTRPGPFGWDGRVGVPAVRRASRRLGSREEDGPCFGGALDWRRDEPPLVSAEPRPCSLAGMPGPVSGGRPVCEGGLLTFSVERQLCPLVAARRGSQRPKKAPRCGCIAGPKFTSAPGRRRGGSNRNGVRRHQGGGEVPPRMPGSREEERSPAISGPSGAGVWLRRCQGGGEAPSLMSETPGRRRGVRHVVGGSRLRERSPVVGCGDTREEERCRRLCLVPGRRRGTLHSVSSRANAGTLCKVATVPGRRRGTVADTVNPREEERGPACRGRQSLAREKPDCRVRRHQGGGEVPPLMLDPREEERGLHMSLGHRGPVFRWAAGPPLRRIS